MIAAPQHVAAVIGKWGCYLLSILRKAEEVLGRNLDPMVEFGNAVTEGFVRASDSFVLDPAKLLGSFIGGTWIMFKAGDGLDSAGKPYDLPLSYKIDSREVEILRYEIPGTEGHFVLGDGTGGIAWDSFGKSITASKGKLVSKRIFRRIA
jgi:hypothetical protein